MKIGEVTNIYNSFNLDRKNYVPITKKKNDGSSLINFDELIKSINCSIQSHENVVNVSDSERIKIQIDSMKNSLTRLNIQM